MKMIIYRPRVESLFLFNFLYFDISSELKIQISIIGIFIFRMINHAYKEKSGY